MKQYASSATPHSGESIPVPKSRESISSLYILKALCALGVVILHAPFGVLTDSLRTLAAITVPVFYMITGYFLYTPDDEKLLSRLRGSSLKVLRLILILNIVYTLIFWRDIPPLNQYMVYFKWFVLGQHYAGGHLWYLMSLLQGLLVLYLLVRVGWSRYIPWLSLLWLESIAMGDYREMLLGTPESMLNCNCISFSIPCLSMGYFIKKREGRILSSAPWGVVALCSVALALINLWWGGEFVGCQWIMRPWLRVVMMLSVFLFFLGCKFYGRGSFVERVGRDYSGSIYYFHGLFIALLSLSCWGYIAYDAWGAVYVFVLSLGCAMVVDWGQKSLGVRWLS